MVGLRSQLNDTRIRLLDWAFYSSFTESLPPSLDLFIALYEDNTYDNQVQEGQGVNIVLSGQQLADKKQDKKKRDLTGITCYGCGQDGHLWRSCLTKWDEKSITGQG